MRLAFPLLFACGVLVVTGACGTDAVGVETCRKVEEARCRKAPDCGIALDQPPHVGDDVDACIRFYRDACLHGLETQADPGTVASNACVGAIQNADCTTDEGKATVQHPETNAACTWLVPSATPAADAGLDVVEDIAPPIIPDAARD